MTISFKFKGCMDQKLTPFQNRAYKRACELIAKLSAEIPLGRSGPSVLVVSETYGFFETLINSLFTSLRVSHSCLKNWFWLFRHSEAKSRAHKAICRRLKFKSLLTERNFFRKHLAIFESCNLFDNEDDLAMLLDGEDLGYSSRLTKAGDRLYVHMVANFLELQNANFRSLLARLSPPPRYSENTLQRFMVGKPKKACGFFEKLVDVIAFNKILTAEYNVLIAELPITLANSWVYDSTVSDTYENTSVEFLHRCVKMLQPGGSAFLIIPSSLKKAPGFEILQNRITESGNSDIKPCNSLFDIWIYSSKTAQS